jgi:hypothetical protein
LKRFDNFVQHAPEDLLASAYCDGDVQALLKQAEVVNWLGKLPRDALSPSKLTFEAGESGKKMPLLLRIIFHWVDETKRRFLSFPRALSFHLLFLPCFRCVFLANRLYGLQRGDTSFDLLTKDQQQRFFSFVRDALKVKGFPVPTEDAPGAMQTFELDLKAIYGMDYVRVCVLFFISLLYLCLLYHFYFQSES